MRTILFTTGITPCDAHSDHRWRIKTYHDSIGSAHVLAMHEMRLEDLPADGYVMVAEDDCNHIIESSLPGNITFIPELGAFK